MRLTNNAEIKMRSDNQAYRRITLMCPECFELVNTVCKINVSYSFDLKDSVLDTVEFDEDMYDFLSRGNLPVMKGKCPHCGHSVDYIQIDNDYGFHLIIAALNIKEYYTKFTCSGVGHRYSSDLPYINIIMDNNNMITNFHNLELPKSWCFACPHLNESYIDNGDKRINSIGVQIVASEEEDSEFTKGNYKEMMKELFLWVISLPVICTYDENEIKERMMQISKFIGYF